MAFSNGDTLHISKQPEFESYRLKIGTQELIAQPDPQIIAKTR
jgi:hypothetical protein